jgi:hypothetical protein
MGIFANLPTVAPKPIPQSFELEVLQRRIEEVRLHYGQASGRLFDLCCSIQRTGELPDPEDLSHTLATFLHARAMVELLEEMHIDVQVKQATLLGDPQRRL